MPKFPKKDPVTTKKAPVALAEVFGRLLLRVAGDELPLEQAEEEFRNALLGVPVEAREGQVAELDFNYGRLRNALPHLLAAFKRALATYNKQL